MKSTLKALFFVTITLITMFGTSTEGWSGNKKQLFIFEMRETRDKIPGVTGYSYFKIKPVKQIFGDSGLDLRGLTVKQAIKKTVKNFNCSVHRTRKYQITCIKGFLKLKTQVLYFNSAKKAQLDWNKAQAWTVGHQIKNRVHAVKNTKNLKKKKYLLKSIKTLKRIQKTFKANIKKLK